MTSGYHRYILIQDYALKGHSLIIKKGTLVCGVEEAKPSDPSLKVITIMPDAGPEIEIPADILEPIFVLRSQDILAPQLVRQWAERAASTNCPGDKVQGAKDFAEVMEKWPIKKYPD